jgi:hypothetical protein
MPQLEFAGELACPLHISFPKREACFDRLRELPQRSRHGRLARLIEERRGRLRASTSDLEVGNLD